MKRPNEVVSRYQDGCCVSLWLYDNKHLWFIVPLKINGQDNATERLRVRVDRPMDQQELFRWLAKTQPIE